MTQDASAEKMILSIDQGTTNTKAVLVTAAGQVVAAGAAVVGVTSVRAGWIEQDARRIWASVLEAVQACLEGIESEQIVGVALSTQRESVVGWSMSTGEPLGPVIGWQDSRTAEWCETALGARARNEVSRRTGLRVDAMFSAPKIRWILDHLPDDVSRDDVAVGTIDAWLIWLLTGGAEHVCEAGNASRTLLYDVTDLAWSPELLDVFGIPAEVLPHVRPSTGPFGSCTGVAPIPDGTPILAVLADSHAALYGQGCVQPGMAKATYGTGSSVMTPIAHLPRDDSAVPTTLAWLIGDTPTYALEGNILSSGSTLGWMAALVSGGDVGQLVALAETVHDSGGVTLVPAFSGLGAPHWQRDTQALISGITTGTVKAHIARAAVDSIAHQICDVVDVMEKTVGPLQVLHADGGATISDLVVQTQADLLDRIVEVSEVAEVSALGAAQLAWTVLNQDHRPEPRGSRRWAGTLDPSVRRSRRTRWAGEVKRAHFTPEGATPNRSEEHP